MNISVPRKAGRKKSVFDTPTEHVEQVNLIRWANHHWFGPFLFHIPNGGLRNKATAAKLKAAGVKAGVPDLFLAITQTSKTDGNHWHGNGLFIELKRKKGGKVSDNQALYIEKLRNQSYEVVVCDGWVNAAKAINEYLGIKNCMF